MNLLSNFSCQKLFTGLATALVFAACTPTYNAYISNYRFANASPVPDYHDLNYWAAHPHKKDPSDSIPTEIQTKNIDSVADVFFIHPTTYTGTKQNWNADINDAELNAKTDYSSILYQASVFNEHCRVFAPRYRQIHLKAFYTKEAEALKAFDMAYADVKNAFEFYLKHHHNNRPVIIAGHSQGALLCNRLMKEFFDGKPLQQKLVAAYIIGWPVAEQYFTNIPACTNQSQTGCFVSWRTYRKGHIPAYIQKENNLAVVTNPLSWTITNEYVSSEKNKGSVLRDFNKIIFNTTDAQVGKGVLWVNRPKFPGSIFFRTRNYHIADVNLYYMNIRENVAQRIASFKYR